MTDTKEFIVVYRPQGESESTTATFHASDVAHAGEQCDGAYPFCEVLLVLTREEYTELTTAKSVV